MTGDGEEDLVEAGLGDGDLVHGDRTVTQPDEQVPVIDGSASGAVMRPDSGVTVASRPSTVEMRARASSMRSRSASVSCSAEVPTDAFNSSAVPSAMTLPRSITAIRSANWSASSRYWVVSRTVDPSATSRRIVSHIWARVRGSRPVVGSSRNNSGGRAMRLAARSRRRRMPPEKFFSGLDAASVRPNSSSSSVDLRLASRRLRPSSREKMTRFSVAVRSSSTEAYCPVTPTSERTAVDSRTTSRPKMRASPPSGRKRVASMRTVVVLPAPLGPSTPYTARSAR